MEIGGSTAPMLLMNGTADANIPWEGTGVTRDGQTVYVTYPVSDTMGYWAAFNRCNMDAATEIIPEGGESPGTEVRILTLDCPDETSVVLYGVIGGGHYWHRPDGREDTRFGRLNRDIDATEAIWAFFERHAL
jgi:polyhydroxybutyrate depolymerase